MKRALSTRAVARGLAPTEPSDNVLIAYAARDGTTASDGEGRNSPFTTALLRHIETPGLEISFLFRRVRDDVMTATKREQQPFVYGSLSKEEIYLRLPAVIDSARLATDPVVKPEDEKFWQAIQTSTAVASYEEFLSRFPRSSRVAEARQRIKDLKSKELAAASSATTASKPEENSNNGKGGEDPGSARPLDRNLFTAEHSQKIAAVGAAQRLDMPKFTIPADQDVPLGANSRFVGVWSSKLGWNGKGRHAMLIITEVSATGLARGYYVWGPPVKQSWTQDAAGHKWFSEYIVDSRFSIKTAPEIKINLDDKNVLKLQTARSDRPADKSSIELRPIWQHLRVRGEVEPSTKRERSSRPQASRHEAPKREAAAGSSPPRNVSGSTMEDRYRACRKLVKGFAQREACARNGSI